MEKLKAVIDLGTNTFQFGIAKIENNNFTYIFEKSLAPKIGKGGISEGKILPEAIDRAMNVLAEFSKIAFDFGIKPHQIHCFGTSAIRNAKNGDDFCELVNEKLNLNIQIIDGNKEAELICEGVKYAVSFEQEPYLIMDIGGGSVEFIIANKSQIFWKQSFEIGGQRLMDQFFTEDPIAANMVRKLKNYLEEKLIDLTNAIHQYAPKTLVGSAGSFETLLDIYQSPQQTFISLENQISAELPLASFYDSYAKFLEMNRTERLLIPGMIELRVDMIVVASVLIDFCLKNYKIDRIFVSNFALKEGVLVKLARNEPI